MTRRGLTLLEVVVSFGILAVLLTCFSALFIALFRSSLLNTDRLEGVSVLESVYEIQRNLRRYPASTGNQTLMIYSRDASQPTQYIYSMDVQTINAATKLYQVDLNCWWNNGEVKSGGGQIHLKMTRLMTP